MRKWEYLVTDEVEELAKRGDEGWELVSVLLRPGGEQAFYFKRPGQSLSERITLEQRACQYESKGVL